jgi:flagellar biosynthesis/type III secretory pathway protein FliH
VALAPSAGAQMTSRPHDALFKRAFEAPADAAPLLRELLPVGLSEAIAWETLIHEAASFVDPALNDSHGDRLFSARLRDSASAAVCLLLEHQSTDDAELPMRALSYQVRIWERMRQEKPPSVHGWLTPIITVVVSHARGGWTSALLFEALFDPSMMAIPGMAALVPRFSLILDDLTERSNDDLKARSLGAFQKLALWLLRDARDPPRLLGSFDTWQAEILHVLRRPDGRDAFITLVTYLFQVVDPLYWNDLHAKIDQLGRRAKETTMTIAEWLREEGHKEGREKGREEGCIATLRSQLLFKFKLQKLDERAEARLRAATPEAIDRYVQRVLIADSLAEVFDE